MFTGLIDSLQEALASGLAAKIGTDAKSKKIASYAAVISAIILFIALLVIQGKNRAGNSAEGSQDGPE